MAIAKKLKWFYLIYELIIKPIIMSDTEQVGTFNLAFTKCDRCGKFEDEENTICLIDNEDYIEDDMCNECWACIHRQKEDTITISKSEYQSLINAQYHMNFMANNPLGNDGDEILKLIANKFDVELPLTIYGCKDEEWYDEVRKVAAAIMSENDYYDWRDAMHEAIEGIFFKCELTEQIKLII